MAVRRIEEIARDLVSGYPTQEPERVQQELTQVLEVVLPALADKAASARRQGKDSVEEIWKALRSTAEEDFHRALAHVERLKVLYVASKFMNNKAVGTSITETALELASSGLSKK